MIRLYFGYFLKSIKVCKTPRVNVTRTATALIVHTHPGVRRAVAVLIGSPISSKTTSRPP